MAETLLRCEGLQGDAAQARPGQEPVLHPLDLELRRGELMVLLSPDAASLEALLELLTGFAPPRAGRLVLSGRDIAALPPAQRSMPLVSRAGDLLPRLTVAENLALPLRLRGMGRAQRRREVQEALALHHLETLARLRPQALSPAERQRVALARALLAAPSLLLVEEPLFPLPAEARLPALLEWRALQQRLGIGMLCTTQQGMMALTLADRIAVLASGRLRQLATPREVYDRPADAAVAGMFGEVNRLPGIVVRLQDDECRVKLDHGPEVEAMLGDAAGPGTRCQVVIRPERVAVAAVAAETLGEGALPATLREARFQGEHVRLRLALADGAEVVAHRPAGLRLPEPGAPAAVTWNVGHATAFRI